MVPVYCTKMYYNLPWSNHKKYLTENSTNGCIFDWASNQNFKWNDWKHQSCSHNNVWTFSFTYHTNVEDRSETKEHIWQHKQVTSRRKRKRGKKGPYLLKDFHWCPANCAGINVILPKGQRDWRSTFYQVTRRSREIKSIKNPWEVCCDS